MVDTSNQSVPEMAIELPYVFVWLDPQALVKQEAMTVEKMQQSIAHVQRAELGKSRERRERRERGSSAKSFLNK